VLLHMVFSTVKENYALVVGFVLCCSSCCVIVGLGYNVCCIGFRCHIMCYAHWSGGKCRDGAGACSAWLP